MLPILPVLGACLLPGPALAQETPVDSLRTRIVELEARIDSLLRELRRRDAPAAADDAAAAGEEPGDELARLRAAAREAAGDTAAAETETGEQRSRTRSLQALNPEISVTGDVVGTLGIPASGDPDADAVPREFEFSFQSALDPHTRTKVFVTRHEDFRIAGLEPHALDGLPEAPPDAEPGHAEEEGHGFEIEEGYMYWVGLPAGFGAKVGKFRQEIGLFNRWHTHALHDVDRPLASVAFLGEEGLIQTGASLTAPSFGVGPATQTLTLQTTLGNNDRLFDGGNELSHLARLQSFWDLGAASFLQLGATGVYGENDEADDLTSRLLELDVYYRWTPPGRSLYRDLQLRGAWYAGEKQFADREVDGHGGYAQASYRLGRQWVAGLRADHVDPFGPDPELTQLAPSLTWWQSEWVRVRLQYNWLNPSDGDVQHTVLLQTVWAMGPHKHESY